VKPYDAIVLGLGAVGSAAAYQLGRRGARVLGLDRQAPPHVFGSSHGGTRITRLAIGEGAHYTPLVMRAHEIWRDIERETGAELLTANGMLAISSAATTAATHVEGFFRNTVSAAERYGIAHELLDAAEIRRRYPQFAVTDNEFGYFEPSAGFLRPEQCVHWQLELARKHGAELHMGETALGFEPGSASVRVTTDRGRYEAGTLIVAVGAWAPGLLGPELASLFKVHRQVQFWFAPNDDGRAWQPDRMPVFIWELPVGKQGIYGFPAIDGGVKVATESYEATTDPDAVAREVSDAEAAAMHERYVAPFFPGLGPVCTKAATCLYTVTPDFGFVVDRHPEAERVIVASPCSGHGFKHSPAIGEALADLVLEGRSRHDLAPFALGRFGRGRPSKAISNP
jgi:sarcosine oxidase